MPAKQRKRGNLSIILFLAALLSAGLASLPIGTVAAADYQVSVTTTADTIDGDTVSFDTLSATPGADGAVSLREAITAANAMSGAAELLIDFAIPNDDPGRDAARGVWIITLDTPLPSLSRGYLTLDGSTQPGAAARPSVVLDGYNVAEPEGDLNGITITSSGNTVRRLGFVNFLDAGVQIRGLGADNNRVFGCVIGLQPDSDIIEPNYYGVELRSGASANQIGGDTAQERNIISGNDAYGVFISGASTSDNTIAGNWIGLGHSGKTPRGNIRGIVLTNGAHTNNIGVPGAGNVIAANYIGVELTSGAYRNSVAANILGLGADGVTTRAVPSDELTTLGNLDGGVFLSHGSYENTIGGTTAAERNIIANNGFEGTAYGDGVYIDGSGTRANRVLGNYIGVDRSGIVGRGNLRYGVSITSTAAGNIVGDAADNGGNVVAYNGRGGIRISSTANQVAGNLIGLGADGQTPLGNQLNGVDVDGEANVVGPGNTIAFNQLSGIVVNGGSTSVFSNDLYNNDHSGVCVAGSNTTVTDNQVYENGGRTTSRTNCNIQGGIVVDSASRTVISANVVRDNRDVGIRISGGSGNRIQVNSISENALAGIKLEAGGNQGIAPPVIAVTSETVTGQGCGLCTIEVFADYGDEGNRHIGTTTSDTTGAFVMPFQPSAVAEPNITATNTDIGGNTSPFAAPRIIPRGETNGTPDFARFLPFVSR